MDYMNYLDFLVLSFISVAIELFKYSFNLVLADAE